MEIDLPRDDLTRLMAGLERRPSGIYIPRWLACDSTGAMHITDGQGGLGVYRFVSATAGVATTLAAAGVDFGARKAKGIVIDSVRIVTAGVLPVVANADFTVRVAVDAPNDGVAQLMIPAAAPASSPTADLGQIRSFNLTPFRDAAGNIGVYLPQPIPLDIPDPIRHLHFTHNFGQAATTVLQFGISAMEDI